MTVGACAQMMDWISRWHWTGMTIQDVTVIAGLCIAWFGLDGWYQEHVGKRRIELAEEALALFYEAADVVRYIRNPAAFGHELARVERLADETDADYRFRQTASLALLRASDHRELFGRLHAMRYRFIAAFGKEQSAPFDTMHAINNKIRMAAQVLPRYWTRTNFATAADRSAHDRSIERQEGILWTGASDPDPIEAELVGMIDAMEAACRPVIVRQRWWSRMVPLWLRRRLGAG